MAFLPPFIVPQSEPFLFQRGPVGCLLLHGFTSMPEEMRPLGESLAERDFTVLGVRSPGHATHPAQLARVRWYDWLVTIEDGLALLRGCEHIVVIGQSLGGNAALLAASLYDIAAVVTLATPYPVLPWHLRMFFRVYPWLRPTVRKQGPLPHPELGIRREAAYPAYQSYPSRIVNEAFELQRQMKRRLAAVRVPALLMHAKADPFADSAGMEMLHASIASTRKEMMMLDGDEHSLSLEPKLPRVAEEIERFIRSVI